MADISAASSIGNSNSSSPTKGNSINDVDVSQFLNLMIAELQNQDPLNPMDNTQMVQQVSQIQQIGATNKLSNTLAGLQLGQNLSTASSLIGKKVTALGDDGSDVQGVVDRVTVEVDSADSSKTSLKGHIGDSSFSLSNVREVDLAS